MMVQKGLTNCILFCEVQWYEISKYSDFLAGIYRKIQVPDAFGPLVNMLIKNSIDPPNPNQTFDPNEEIGGAILSYLSDNFRK